MPEEDTTTTETATTVTEGLEPTETGTGPVEPNPTEPAPVEPGTGDEGFADLPPRTQKEIRLLRAENARYRTQVEEKAAASARDALADAETARIQAVADAKAEAIDTIAKALGMKPADTAELTPEQVIEKLTAERDAEKTAREDRAKKYSDLLLEVAVQDAANMHDAKADRLLDSRSVMRALRALDPDQDGYRVAVAEAVQAAVEADPSLKVTKRQPAPPASGGTATAGTPTKKPEDMTVEDFIEAKIHRRD